MTATKYTKYKQQRENLIGTLITSCADDELYHGIVLKWIGGNRFRVFADGRPLRASYNSKFGFWTLI